MKTYKNLLIILLSVIFYRISSAEDTIKTSQDTVKTIGADRIDSSKITLLGNRCLIKNHTSC